jgi:Arc/MetJ family transcription regulator
MMLAEVEAYLSRPIAPTRRVALGESTLPVSPAPGFGGVLLGGIVARFAPDLDDDMLAELGHLIGELEVGRRIPQPRLRHRFQKDRIGLQRCRHRLVGVGETLHYEFDEEKGTSAQHVLCAVYAAGALPGRARPAVMDALRRGVRWRGAVDHRLASHLTGAGSAANATVSLVGDPVGWALGILDLTDPGDDLDLDAGGPTRQTVQRAFREALRAAHPDHGADHDGAADRIAQLAEARRILLG